MNEPRTIEASGPDIESAISKGVSELGVSRDDVIVEVLEEPGRRLLGLGSKMAKVRLTVIKVTRPPAPAVQPAAPVTAPAAKPPAPVVQPAAPVTPSAAPIAATPTPDAPAPAAPAADRPARPPKRARDFDDYSDDEASEGSPEELAHDANVGAETLRELLTHLEIDAQVIARAADSEQGEAQHWTLEIQGRDLGALIGRKGETLAALQYITRLIASRDLERRANIVIDVEGYKSRRETMLRRLAKRMAEQAVERGRTVSLEPMPPHERRIIHLTLRSNPDVTTESVGEGEHRKVTIIPKRAK